MMTNAELAEIREYQRKRNREWWAKQSPDERRERRQRYALNAARNKVKRELKRELDADQ